jgi:hypothetical protein
MNKIFCSDMVSCYIDFNNKFHNKFSSPFMFITNSVGFRLFAAALLLGAQPVVAQDNLLDRLRGLIQDKPQAVTVQRPQAQKIDVAGALPDLNDQSCSKNPMLRTAQTTITFETQKTTEQHVFLDSQPAQKITGISNVQLNGAKLKVDFFSQGRFEEFTGPIANIIEKKQYEARPGTALIAHTLTLGLGVLFAPVNSVQHALGCTDSRVIRREVILVESAVTGQSKWLSTGSTHVIRIEGLGAIREFNFESSGVNAQKSFELDLLPMIMRGQFDKPLDITITCLSCNALEAAKLGLAQNLQNQSVLGADFSEIRSAELNRLERIANEERLARQKIIESQQSILRFKKMIVGRWASPEVCLNEKSKSVGQLFELDGDERLSMFIRTTDVAGQVIDRARARDIQIRQANLNDQTWELKMNLSVPGSSVRPIERVYILKLRDENMQMIDQRDGNNVIIRSGLIVSTGREVSQLSNCEHPSLIAQRAKLESEERERIRRAQAAVEEQRQRAEREEADRQRRQKERERLYKL